MLLLAATCLRSLSKARLIIIPTNTPLSVVMITNHKPSVMSHLVFFRTLTLGVSLLLLSISGFAQSGDSRNESQIFTVVEKHPEFTGGIRAFQDYLATNVRYPAAAAAAKVTGKVFVNFIVRDDGRITDVNVLKGLGHGCDEEAVRVISAMPNWKPGTQSGRPVNVKYNVVVPFGTDYPRSRRR